MVFYYNTLTKEYPLKIDDIYNCYPEYNVYQPLPDGIVEYIATEKPNYNNQTETCVLNGIKEIDGIWQFNWEIVDTVANNYDHESQIWYPANPLVRANNV
jgi:hypothetical protein